MAHTIASSSTSASPNKSYHVFIHHHGLNVKKTFASHLYHRLCSEHNGLRVFLDQTELRVGDNFDYQIKDTIKTASVHVAIFSKGYADSERCLNELLYMLESRAPIIPVFYDVEPAQLRWPQGKVGVYAEAPCILENEKTTDCQTIEEKPQHSSTTIQKWKGALSRVADISGLDLQKTCNGDEGDLVQKIVQRVLEEIESILSVGISVFYRSPLYGGHGGDYWNDGTYSGIKRITMTAKDNSLTSVQLHYALEGDESGKDIFIFDLLHGRADGAPIEYNLNYPDEIVTKISGYFGSHKSWPLVIKSLTFHTNQRKLGPCGQEQGTLFETEVGGKIVGVFGTSGTVLDSIGVYMLKPRTSKNEEFYCSEMYGGPAGGSRSDGTYSGIRRITTTVNDNLLTSVQLQYGLEGDESLKERYLAGARYGLVGGAPTEYNLNYPQEIVTKISGYFGSYKDWPKVIKSLTFHTNQRTLGPSGQEQGTFFETEVGGKIVGIFGTCGTVLDSIGVYMLKQKTSEDGSE